MRILRPLFLVPFLLICAPKLRATIVYGTANTTQLPFGSTTLDPFDHTDELAIEFTVPVGENFVPASLPLFEMSFIQGLNRLHSL